MNDPIRVTVWNEARHEKTSEAVRTVYPDGIHAAIAEFLNAAPGIEARTATLEYTLDGVSRRMEFEQADDWLNPKVAMDILDDFGDVPGRVRLFIDNGQGGTYVWLPEEGIAEFQELFPEAKRS